MEDLEATRKRPAEDEQKLPAAPLTHEHTAVHPGSATSITAAPSVTAEAVSTAGGTEGTGRGARAAGAAHISSVQAATADLVAQASANPDTNSSAGHQPAAKPKGAPRGRYVIVDPNRPKKAKVPRGPSDNNTGSSLKSGGTCTACAGSKVKCDKKTPNCARCMRLGIECVWQGRGRGRPPNPNGRPNLAAPRDRMVMDTTAFAATAASMAASAPRGGLIPLAPLPMPPPAAAYRSLAPFNYGGPNFVAIAPSPPNNPAPANVPTQVGSQREHTIL